MAKKKAARRKSKRASRAGATTVASTPARPSSDELKYAHAILCDGIASVNSLATLYNRATATRGPGAPTHEEQDLLRAMVVMAGATIDATIKRVIRDALLSLVNRSTLARSEVEKHIKRRMLADLDKRGGDRLAQVLLDDAPRQRIIGFVIEDVTGDSLQSEDEVRKAGRILGLESLSLPDLREAFSARNEIVHEMDSLHGVEGTRNRRQRRRADMHGFAKNLIDAAAAIVRDLDAVLQGC